MSILGKFEIKYINYNYNTGEPYETPYYLEIEDDGKPMFFCGHETEDDEECVWVFPEWIPEIIKILETRYKEYQKTERK